MDGEAREKGCLHAFRFVWVCCCCRLCSFTGETVLLHVALLPGDKQCTYQRKARKEKIHTPRTLKRDFQLQSR